MKKINKFFSVFLAVLMVICALPISASATDVTFTVTSSVNDIKAGDTVTISVNLSENSNLNAFTIDVVYDSSKLEYTAHNLYGICGYELVNEVYADGKFRFVGANENPITTDSTFLSIQFTALASSCNTVSLDIIESVDKELNPISTTSVSATLHSYGEWITETEPACESVGQKSKSCTCGEKITETIDSLGHDYAIEFTTDVEPNCTESGSKSQHCSRCDSKQNVTEIPATGHDYKEEITKIPTHTENGEKKFTCNNCGDTYKETIEADGTHKHISAVTKEPTCTETGVMTYTCACGDEYTEEISALGHTSADAVEENYVAPNCTDKGSKDLVVYCSVCDTELSRETEEIDALGHTEEELTAVAPACTETGLTAGEKCSVCGEVLVAQEEIPATGHNVNSDGYCDNCDEKLCDHNCHKSGISGFFWKIANFFNKLFGTKKYCECGIAHY